MNTYSFATTIVPVAGDCVTLGAIVRAAGANSAQGMYVRLLRVKVGPSKATAAGVQTVQLITRSQADTAGTGAAQTPALYDVQDPAPQAPVTLYTAAPTTGGSSGIIGCELLASGATTSVGNLVFWRWDDTMGVGTNVARVPLLRSYAAGGNQPIVALNFSAALAGQVCPVEIVWTEGVA